MRFVTLLIFLVIAFPVSAEERQERLTLGEGEHYEICSIRSLGDVIDYQFSTSDTVDFNIHFHKEGMTRYPVKQKNVRSLEGTYSVDTAIGHCLMWNNRHPWEVDVDIIVSYR